MHPRERLRRTTLPNLYDIDRKSTLAGTTTSEINDSDIGLPDDPVAQRCAIELFKAATAWENRQRAKTLKPVSIQIAMEAEDDDGDNETIPDVVESLTPQRSRFGSE